MSSFSIDERNRSAWFLPMTISYLRWAHLRTDNRILRMFSMLVEYSIVFVPSRSVIKVLWTSQQEQEAFVRWMNQVGHAVEHVLDHHVSPESVEHNCPVDAVVPIEYSTPREHDRTCLDDELSKCMRDGIGLAIENKFHVSYEKLSLMWKIQDMRKNRPRWWAFVLT